MIDFSRIQKSLLLASFFILIVVVWCFQYAFTAWLIWFAYVPFLFFLSQIKGNYLKLIIIPFLAIFFTYCVAFNWYILIPQNTHLVVAAVAIESLVDSLPFGIYLMLHKKTQNPKWIWIVPFMLCIEEYIWWHLNLMPPVPLAHTQASLTFVSQYVDVFGPTGATFFIMLINVTVFRFMVLKKSFGYIVTSVGLILLIPVAYSIVRVNEFNAHQSKKNPLVINLFRLDIPASGDDLFQNRMLDFKRLEQDVYLTDSVTYYEKEQGIKSDLYVWHESAFTRLIPKVDNYVRKIITENGVTVLTGVEMRDSIDNNKTINGSMVFYPDGSISDLYIKMNFVNYWENNYKRGQKRIMHKVKNNSNEVFEIATPICFEQFIPEHWAAFRNIGADIFVQICFETWFSNGFGSEPGLSNITALRCMENKIYGARTSNGGAAAFIDPLGRQYKNSTSGLTLKGDIYKSCFKPTFYSRYPWFGISCVAIGLICLVLYIIIQKK